MQFTYFDQTGRVMRRIALSMAAGLAIIPVFASADDTRLSTACDLAAASPADRSRPAGIAGITLDKIEAKVAIPACEAALAAEPGNPRLLFQMGRTFSSIKDYEKARAFYEKAAGLGYASAQTSLGVLYENGRGGLPKDDREAARLYKLAAEQGEGSGQNNLGFFYQMGRGGLPKDDREAARLYELAAAQGNAAAQINLGGFYERGLGGLAKDDQEAGRLYKLAADRGNAAARAFLARLPARARDAADIGNVLRAQMAACWTPPVGAANVVSVRVKLNQDGSLSSEPILLSSDLRGQVRAEIENVFLAIKRCQPFKLPIANYDAWKDIEIVFDPRTVRPP
jgi:TPR repeat protein